MTDAGAPIGRDGRPTTRQNSGKCLTNHTVQVDVDDIRQQADDELPKEQSELHKAMDRALASTDVVRVLVEMVPLLKKLHTLLHELERTEK